MKALLTLLLGLGALTAVSCTSTTETADVHASETVTLGVTGMT